MNAEANIPPLPAAGAQRALLFALFAVSGFAGLIYESIWSHYLKLFLGHAAYAQTLVLALFMGGMALGSAGVARYGERAPRLLRAYAVVEVVIGLAALAFHDVFVAVTETAYASWLPASSGPLTASAIKWTLAALLILPQSVLLGATFPLISGGLLRRHPARPGESLALLYFTNSLGAAAGVLASGFVLIDRLGLPGTVQAAGMINLGLAAAVWLLAPGPDPRPAPPRRVDATPLDEPPYRLLLAVALLTGTASFIYEVGWIRMLSLVLGSATHAFELMLSAFILGIAFGGLWVRRRIDAARDPIRFLGLVQVVMGLVALATLPIYDLAFDAMQGVIRGTAKTDAGYAIFLAASHGIAIAVMFPAAFCAGMTLPIITFVLFRSARGEQAIGAVYAANTLGSILGVMIAAHLLLPLAGLKVTITAGAALDVALGLVLLRRSGPRMLPAAATAVAGAAFAAVLAGVALDPYRMASGVFRRGDLYSAGQAELLYYRDGKTASVSLVRFPEGTSLRTNGKSDGAINLGDGPRISDEVTMVLTAALPLAHRPDARTAAVIGIGTGLTTHTLLGSPVLERVDTIEIEPAMAEASRQFAARNANVWADPRSRLIFDDAKTFFSLHNARYDIIISEPSNPWVSGVSSLFTAEFYRHVRRYLAPGGVLVQWFQLYEMDVALLASVLQALGDEFEDYAIYAATDSDLLIVAGDRATVTAPPADVFAMPGVAAELRRVHVRTIGDIDLRRVGTRRTLHPLFLSYGVPPNSDFAPYLDLHAARHRFLQSEAVELTRLGLGGVPVTAMVAGGAHWQRPPSYDGDDYLERIEAARRADYVRRYYLDTRPPEPRGIPLELEKNLELTRMRGLECVDPHARDAWLRGLFEVQKVVNSAAAPPDAAAIWARFESAPCAARLDDSGRNWLALYSAVARRDGPRMAALADDLLAHGAELSSSQKRYLLKASLAGHLAGGTYAKGVDAWNAHIRDAARTGMDLDLQFLYAWLAVARTMQQN
jgi:predicted membrane-bound spermidine synthase